ncbi:unnamed protein product [Cyclocybe aegerita]|uniref:DUF6589 domain-containing protein n=1 Tax=Cyclocybe aegerita TaxID=1973307 RepID=A0A8S0W3D0_CYCAE|nr:unnamed protein product [Cyclocybe aegerita]
MQPRSSADILAKATTKPTTKATTKPTTKATTKPTTKPTTKSTTTKSRRKRPAASTNVEQRLSFSFSSLSGTGPSNTTNTSEHLTFGNPEPAQHQFNFRFKASKLSASAPEASGTHDDGVLRDLGTVEQAVDFVGGEFSGAKEPNPTTFPLSAARAEEPPRTRILRTERIEKLVREIVGKEMDTVNKASQAPVLMGILFTAAETSLAAEKNKNKRPDATCNTIVRQLSYQRSNRSLGFATVFGLFLWTSGCSRQTIDSLHRCGLSVCYSSVLKSIQTLADQCMQLAIQVGTGLHVFCYDNVNISTSIHVEQRGSTGPAKVTSGTFGVVYKVRNGRLEDMKLAPILERFKKVEGLDFNRDIRPSMDQLKSFQTQLTVVIVRVLTTYCHKFKDYSQVPTLQHPPRRRMPAGYKTEQFPIRITTIEEATVRGNLLYHDDVYLNQLNRPLKDLCEYAIPTFNDQLTASRIRSGQIMRAWDVNAWTRREVLVLGFGLFHLCLNLIWALLHIHRGSLSDVGSLAYFFVVMEKTRLAGEHPDYHTLLSALTQIADGIILNAWRHETGYDDLARFADSKPSSEELLKFAESILANHATPMPEPKSSNAKEDSDKDELSDESLDDDPQTAVPNVPNPSKSKIPDPGKDKAHQNLRLLARDLLYMKELIRAISDGDIGRIEDFLPQIAMMFRGAGGNNYCTEILHFILNLKHVWTPKFADIMRDNMLVNVSGLEGHAMPIDLNIEHLIGEIKLLLEAKGLESTWERLGNISAAIHFIKKLKKQVALAMSASYQSTTHTKPNTDHLVHRVANKVSEEKLHVYTENRPGNAKVTATPNILSVGEQKLKSSTLSTFNRKVRAMVEGR